MYTLPGATPLPEYVLEYKFLKASLLTYETNDKAGQQRYSNKFSSYDSEKLFVKNLKKQSNDWHYRNKEVVYRCNSAGYRADEWDTIDWKNAIVVFGCSCTVGIGLAEEETVTEQLSTILNRQVINMGVSASSLMFSFTNSVLLAKNFPTPHAVVQLWTNIDRFTIFKKHLIDHAGPWDESALYKEYVHNRYHAMTEARYISMASREMWKNKCKYYSASFFDQTAHYTESDWIEIDNQARDQVHPGRNSAKQMAELIAKHIS